MTEKPSSLSKADIRKILAYLQACTEVFGKHTGELNAMELAFKSMLGALKRDLLDQLQSREFEDD